MTQALCRLVVFLLLTSVPESASSRHHDEPTKVYSPLSASSTGTNDIRTTSPTQTGTCIGRTVNYITHTLPQQCLRTDRVITNATSEATPGKHVESTPQSSNSSINSTTGSSTLSVYFSATPSEDTTSSLSLIQIAAPQNIGAIEVQPTAPASGVDATPDAESPLDNANFLSFEEWKKQNLAKVGQSPENVGNERSASSTTSRQRPGINNALDSLGEDAEIDLDFSGFGGSHVADVLSQHSASTKSTSAQATEEASPGSTTLRSKDAGRTCKERTNYASFDCAATVLKSNSECKSASSVLVEHKDSYMLNICSAQNKFFIVELCNDILIDTVVLANYEFFSSIFRHFRISVSDRYPVKLDKWKDLGTFEARNTREVQAFLVENPLIWARYLRIEFLTHYGNEYYCPVSLLRVHGTTMMQEFRHQEEAARGESNDEEVSRPEVSDGSPVAQEPAISSTNDGQATVQPILPVKHNATKGASNMSVAPHSESEVLPSNMLHPATASTMNATTFTSTTKTTATTQSHASNKLQTTTLGDIEPPATSVNVSQPASLHLQPKKESGANNLNVSSTSNTSSLSTHSGAASPRTNASLTSHALMPDAIASDSNQPASSQQSVASPESTELTPTSDRANTLSSILSGSGATNPTDIRTVSNVNSTRVSSSTATTSTQQPQPSTQESFFKSIHKRLQQLESNSTLSLQYIEEQSRILRDAFTKVEKRQVSATTTFLSQLNNTVMTELHGFRQAYDQLWQSTVIELEGQKEQYQRETLALSSRLTLVAEELVWQKRMGIVQSTLLLLCLGLVLFARQGSGYADTPLMQQMLHKSQSAFSAGWDSPLTSASPVSRSPVSLLRRKIWRSNTEPISLVGGSDTTPQVRDGLDVQLAPPTPESEHSATEPDEPPGEDGEETVEVRETFLGLDGS